MHDELALLEHDSVGADVNFDLGVISQATSILQQGSSVRSLGGVGTLRSKRVGSSNASKEREGKGQLHG